RVVVVHAFEPRLHALGNVRVGGKRDLLDRLRPVFGTLDVEPAVLPLEVLLGSLEQVRSDLPRLVAQLAGNHRRGRARYRGAARRVSTQAVGRRVGVAFLHRDVGRGDAQLFGHDLGEGRLVALALRFGPHPKHRLAGRVDAQLRAVEHAEAEDVVLRAVAGAHHLGEARNADASDLALLATRLDVLAHLVVAELLERDIHRPGVVATVVLPAGGGVVRKLLRPDEVLHPELGLVHAKLDRGVGDETLDQVTRLGHPERAPVGDASGSLVRVVAVGSDVRGRDVIGAGDD